MISQERWEKSGLDWDEVYKDFDKKEKKTNFIKRALNGEFEKEFKEMEKND